MTSAQPFCCLLSACRLPPGGPPPSSRRKGRNPIPNWRRPQNCLCNSVLFAREERENDAQGRVTLGRKQVLKAPFSGRLPREPASPCRQQRRANAAACKVLQVPAYDFRRSTGFLCGKVCSDWAENRQMRRNRASRPDPAPVAFRGCQAAFQRERNRNRPDNRKCGMQAGIPL